VRTDLSLLRTRITVPPGIGAATWTVVAVGTPGSTAPGPTDTRLYAFLQPEPGGGAAMEAALGPATGSQAAHLPESIAAAILPSTLLVALPQEGDGRRVEGAAYDPTVFNRLPYEGIFAVRLGDGVLVLLQTR
jgi:hypothetical protein